MGFIPNRPSELLSAGYDSALLHFDIVQGSILSRFDVGMWLLAGIDSLFILFPASLPPSSGVSLSPPFFHSVAFSDHSAVTASTADGRVWVGRGGDKLIASKKKRSRKWEGLKEDEGEWVSVAEGPVVSVYVEIPPGSESILTSSKELCGFWGLRDVYVTGFTIPVQRGCRVDRDQHGLVQRRGGTGKG